MNLKEGECEVALYSQKVTEKGFVAGTDGNLSLRLPDGSVVCTPSGFSKGEVTEDSLIHMECSGKVISGRYPPSTEIKMHMAIYRKRSDISGIIHTHPPFATAMSCCGISIPTNLLSESIMAIGEVPIVPFATPGSNELAERVVDIINISTRAILLENHGAVTFGRNLREAYLCLESLEHLSRIFLYTGVLGRGKLLPENIVHSLREAGSSYRLADVPSPCRSCPLPKGEKGRWVSDADLSSLLYEFAEKNKDI